RCTSKSRALLGSDTSAIDAARDPLNGSPPDIRLLRRSAVWRDEAMHHEWIAMIGKDAEKCLRVAHGLDDKFLDQNALRHGLNHEPTPTSNPFGWAWNSLERGPASGPPI